MGCCSCLCKSFGEALIVVLNVATILLGLITVAAGALLTWFWYIQFIQDAIIEHLQKLVDPSVIDVRELLNALAGTAEIVGIVVMSIGGVILLFGLVGCCSASCHSGCLMATYGVCLGIVSVALLTTTIAVAYNEEKVIYTPLEYWMYERLQENFTDPLNNQSSVVGVSISATMMGFQCCGVRNYTEFQTCQIWNRNYSYSGFDLYAQVPSACCKYNDKWNSTEIVNSNCLDNPNPSNSNIDKACFPILKDYLEIALAWALCTLGIIGGLMGLLFVYTLVLVCIYTKRKVDKEYKEAKQLFIYPDIAYADIKKV